MVPRLKIFWALISIQPIDFWPGRRLERSDRTAALGLASFAAAQQKVS